jgi:hypothetical protein
MRVGVWRQTVGVRHEWLQLLNALGLDKARAISVVKADTLEADVRGGFPFPPVAAALEQRLGERITVSGK